MSEKERVKWIDYSKGIGILLVVIAHAFDEKNLINIYAYSFHLPLFFVLSGLTLKEHSMLNDKFGDIVKKNVRTIIVPYYFYTMFVVLIELAKNILQSDVDIQSTINILVRWISMRGVKADWFLPCLFFAKIIFIGIYRTIRKKNYTMFAVFVLAVAIMYEPIRPYFLRPVICACVGVFFVAVGFVLKDVHNRINPVSGWGIFVVWIVSTWINGKVSLLGYNFGTNGLLYLLNGIIGSLLIICLTKWLEITFAQIKILDWCGRNSMILMVVHMEIMAFLNAILGKIGLVSGNIVLYKSCLVITTILISILVTPFVNRVYKGILLKTNE